MVAGLAVLVCVVFCLAYLLDGSHFVSWELETVMGDMLRHVTPWTMLALATVYAAGLMQDKSRKRECEALKGFKDTDWQDEESKTSDVHVIRVILAVVAVVFIVLGVMNGGLYDVLVKAINICTECIGLG